MIKKCPQGLFGTVEICGGVCEVGRMCVQGIKHNCEWAYTLSQAPTKEETFRKAFDAEFVEDFL